MQLLADFIPIIVFFIIFKLFGIYAATLSAILISLAQVTYHRVKHGRYDTTQLITLAVLLVFGGATLILHNELYIKWKVTVLYTLFALILLATQWSSKTIMQRLLGSKIDLDQGLWKKLNLSWALFFMILAVLNLYVAYHFSTEAWVNFKLFGVLTLTVLFIVIQSLFLAKHFQK